MKEIHKKEITLLEKYLTDANRGIVIMSFGIILFLFTIGVFATGLYYVILLVSLILTGVGFYKSGLFEKSMKLVKKVEKKVNSPVNDHDTKK